MTDNKEPKEPLSAHLLDTLQDQMDLAYVVGGLDSPSLITWMELYLKAQTAQALECIADVLEERLVSTKKKT